MITKCKSLTENSRLPLLIEEIIFWELRDKKDVSVTGRELSSFAYL